MPFTQTPPTPPQVPAPNVRIAEPDGRPTQVEYDYRKRLEAYQQALSKYLAAMAAAIP